MLTPHCFHLLLADDILTPEPDESLHSRWALFVICHINMNFNRPAQSQPYKTCSALPGFSNPRERVSELCHGTFRLNLTFEVPLMLWSITFDIKAYLSRNGRSSGDDDNADVESGVGLLGVVDVEGEVCWGHSHTEAHPFGELVLAIPNLTWVEIYHLNRGNTLMETTQKQHSISTVAWHT